MTSNLAISVRGIGKQYRRPTASSQHDSIRDFIDTAVRSVFRGRASNDDAPETFWALQDASFDVARGENVGIIGLNGAGKSTMLKILSRIVTPTTGEARINGRLGALLEVGTGFHPDLTGRENAFMYGSILGMSRQEVARKFDAIVEFAELEEFIDMPVKRYSSGMYVRLAFSVAAHLDPDILLLDEVLAVGDANFQRKCMEFSAQLERKGSTILVVSHNMFSIKAMCQRIIYLRQGQIIYDGPTEAGLKLYEDDCRLAAPHWFSPDPGDVRVHIEDVKITDQQGVSKTVFDHGEPMRVAINYKTSGPIPGPNVHVSIVRSDGVACCTYSTDVDQVDFGGALIGGSIQLDIPPLKLVSDMYTVEVVFRENGYKKIVGAQIGGVFHVKHPALSANMFGVYHEPGRWRVTSAA